MYDYYLGGKNHFAADREAADKWIAAVPSGPTGPRENRAFLGRAVQFLAKEAGIRQFLDIGTGLPTTGNVHDVAQAVDPACRVVYADNDPLVLAHARALLTSTPEGRTAYIHADLRDPQAILANPAVRETLDFSQPVALLIVAVLHFIKPDRDPDKAVEFLRSKLAPGSFLVLSHASGEGLSAGQQTAAEGVRSSYETQAANPGVFRRHGEIEEFFGGWPLVPPGLVWTPEWHTEKTVSDFTDNPARAFIMAGVARKP